MTTSIELRNESGLQFTDISSEAWRRYDFPSGMTVMIKEPQFLNVSKSGGHRLLDGDGTSHYIPGGWHHLSWRSHDGGPGGDPKPSPHFVK